MSQPNRSKGEQLLPRGGQLSDGSSETTMTGNTTVYDRWDEFMNLLSAQPRRQIIVSLMEEPEQRWLPLPEAAITPEIATKSERFEMKLYQIHLPLLAEADYIRLTEEPFRVQRGPRFDEPAAVMQVLLNSDDQLPASLVSGCVEDRV